MHRALHILAPSVWSKKDWILRKQKRNLWLFIHPCQLPLFFTTHLRPYFTTISTHRAANSWARLWVSENKKKWKKKGENKLTASQTLLRLIPTLVLGVWRMISKGLTRQVLGPNITWFQSQQVPPVAWSLLTVENPYPRHFLSDDSSLKWLQNGQFSILSAKDLGNIQLTCNEAVWNSFANKIEKCPSCPSGSSPSWGG